MKYNKLYIALGLGSVLAFGSCSDDNGSNPTLIQPTSFVLNTPEYAENVVELQPMTADEGITFTWNQPVFTDNGAPIGNFQNSGICYQVMISPSGNFTKAFCADSIDSKTGTYKGDDKFDYVVLDNIYSTTNTTVLGNDLNYNLNRWNTFSSLAEEKWVEGQDCDPMNVTVKVVAKIAAGPGNYINEIESNPVTIKVKPYWVQAYEKDELVYYFVTGNPNNWSKDPTVPMFPSLEDMHVQTLTTYFWSSWDLKFWDKDNVSDWNNIFATDVEKNRTGEGNITFGVSDDQKCIFSPAEGYYTFTINMSTKKYHFDEYTKTVTDYNKISLIGVNGDWDNDFDLTQSLAGGYGNAPSHVWYKMGVSITSACEVKFRVGHAWDTSWGNSSNFPYGKASEGGNITGVTPGTYNVYFNDITKEYSFVPVE